MTPASKGSAVMHPKPFQQSRLKAHAKAMAAQRAEVKAAQDRLTETCVRAKRDRLSWSFSKLLRNCGQLLRGVLLSGGRHG